MNKNIQYKKLTDICEIITGEWGTEISENSQNIVFVIRTTNFLNNGKIDIENRELIKREIDKNKIEQKQLKKGDIIIEKSGGSPNQPVGRVVFFSLNSNEVFLCNNFTSILRIKENINSKYVFYFFRNSYKNKKVLKFQNKTTGIINLKLQNYLNESCIFLPELKIQNKIVNILDNLENIIEKNQNYLTHLGVLTKSLFTTMFGDIKTNDKNWEIYYWKDVLNIKNGKNQKQVEDINGKYPIYGSGGIIGRSNAYICNENSIIIGRKGNINKPILVKEKFWNVDTAFGLEVKSEKMSYHYLYYFCLFYDFEIHNKTVTIPSLVKSDLEKIVLSVPPIELQNKFAERIEKIEKLKFEIEKSIEIAQNLYDSLISKYFDN